MTLKIILSVMSGLIFITAFFPYIGAIVRKKTSPRKVTWLVWAVGDIVVLIGMLAKHAVNGLMIAAMLGAVTVFVLSLKYGEAGWKTRDKVCLALSGLAIALWLYFGESNFGIALSLASLAIVAWPTYVSAWEKPENEDLRGWVLFNLSNLFAILAIPRVTFADMAPPITFALIDLPMLYLLWLRPNLRQLWTAIVII